jgi:hypothetical protein
MSNDQDKYKNSRRRLKDDAAIARQQDIARQHSAPDHQYQAHRFAKKHAMDCGNPSCTLCGNPRRTFKELTAQEQRLFQDVDQTRNTHGNGLNNNDG